MKWPMTNSVPQPSQGMTPTWDNGVTRLYHSDEHRRLARTIQAGSIPQRPCPRCGCNDLRIASAEFAICQTCGFQPDRPELLIVELAPPACIGVTRVKREILNEHGCEVFFADRPGGKRP